MTASAFEWNLGFGTPMEQESKMVFEFGKTLRFE